MRKRPAHLLASALVTVACHSAAQIQIVPGGVAGIVNTTTGVPLPGAPVRLEAAGRLRTAVTDQSGRFRLDSVPDGDYSLLVRRLGYLPKRISLSIRGNVGRRLTVTLSLPDPCDINCGGSDIVPAGNSPGQSVAASRANRNWCGTTHWMDLVKGKAEDILDEEDSTGIAALAHRVRTRKTHQIIPVTDQKTCERIARVYYAFNLGPYPDDGVAIVRFGDRYAVLGKKYGGEWTILSVYNDKLELLASYGI